MEKNSAPRRKKLHAASRAADQVPDARVAAIALRQHGNVTRAQLQANGLTDDAIAGRLQTGRLHRVHAGVYAVGRPPTTALERAGAAVLAAGPHAALSHVAAMALWGMWRKWPARLELTVARGKPLADGFVVHRSTTLVRSDVVTHLGIRVTSPSRAIVDTAPRIDDRMLARTIDDALRAGIVSRVALLRQVERRHGRPSAARVLRLLSPDDRPSRSDWERAFPVYCRRNGLPRPQLNTVVCGYEVDALFATEKLIVELDGWTYHAGREAFERDRERDADTLRAGFATVRITWQRMRTAPEREAARLLAILAARRALAA